MNELLLEYSKEIGLKEPLTLQELIDSHRNLRSINKSYHDNWNKEVNEAVARRVCAAINKQYVKWSELEKMTLSEIVERI